MRVAYEKMWLLSKANEKCEPLEKLKPKRFFPPYFSVVACHCVKPLLTNVSHVTHRFVGPLLTVVYALEIVNQYYQGAPF